MLALKSAHLRGSRMEDSITTTGTWIIFCYVRTQVILIENGNFYYYEYYDSTTLIM